MTGFSICRNITEKWEAFSQRHLARSFFWRADMRLVICFGWTCINFKCIAGKILLITEHVRPGAGQETEVDKAQLHVLFSALGGWRMAEHPSVACRVWLEKKASEKYLISIETEFSPWSQNRCDKEVRKEGRSPRLELLTSIYLDQMDLPSMPFHYSLVSSATEKVIIWDSGLYYKGKWVLGTWCYHSWM